MRSILARFVRAPAKSRWFTVVALLSISACSGVDITPEETETFAATKYTRFAWRTDPLAESAPRTDILAQKSPSIRSGVEEKLSELGYERVDRDEAEFLIKYVAAEGMNDGRLLHGGSNEQLYPSSVNRQIDGASVDNAQALSGAMETGRIIVMFADANTLDLLWRVQISFVVEDTNRIDEDTVRAAVRRGLAALPDAP